MEKFKTIITKLVKNNPNDQYLGEKVRTYVRNGKKKKATSQKNGNM